ncbi:MAG: 60S ribosomal export protein NMD3 [Candidatus Aenigmatarchaeota archaeon]|nr:MAG: 60S ribosomal export protein NMD3 [Candidatus Aenigmarchaeota archaeon]
MPRKLQQFCPKCGKRVDDLVEGLCESCHNLGKKLVDAPERVSVVTCPSCNRMLVKNEWTRAPADPVLTTIKDSLRVNGQAKLELDFKGNRATLTADGSIEGYSEPRHESYEIAIKHAKRLCDDCVRARGGYYEAIVQIRSEDERNVKRVALLIEEVVEHPRGKYWFVAKMSRVRGGVDIRLGSKAMLSPLKRRLKEDFGALETKMSHELYGHVGGRVVYRDIMLVRV